MSELSNTKREKQTAVYFSAVNAETFDLPVEATADADGHIVNATVLRHNAEPRSFVPVRVRIDQGVAADTAVTMLRKVADMIERTPELLSEGPGTALRRMPDGSTVKKKLTPAKLLEAGKLLDEDDRKRLIELVERLRDDLPPDDDVGPGQSITGPGLG